MVTTTAPPAPLPFPQNVRQRPGMYVGDTDDGSGLLCYALEVIGNALDLYLAGKARLVDVVIDETGAIEVRDDGPGLDFAAGADAYFTSLHTTGTADGHTPHVHLTPIGAQGVGLAVVCALSERLVVDVARAGRLVRHEYARGLRVAEPVDCGSATATGTRVWLRPDPLIFDRPLSVRLLTQRLIEVGYLHPGLRLALNGAVVGGAGGLAAYCTALAEDGALLAPPNHVRIRVDDVDVDVAYGWLESSAPPRLVSFVSTQPTRQHGAHVLGFFSGLRAALRDRVVSADKARADRIRAGVEDGLVAVVHAGLYAPKFGAPTRDRLLSPEAKRAVRAAMLMATPMYLAQYPAVRCALAERVGRALAGPSADADDASDASGDDDED